MNKFVFRHTGRTALFVKVIIARHEYCFKRDKTDKLATGNAESKFFSFAANFIEHNMRRSNFVIY